MRMKFVSSFFIASLNIFAFMNAKAACISQTQAIAAINAKFSANSWLGAPIGQLQGSVLAGGWHQQYSVQNGSIWISACGNTGAHIVQGLILADYNAIGNQNAIGFPITDELRDSNNNPVSWFQNGSIWYQWGNANAYEVQGYIQNKWGALGWFNSALGYPRSNELLFSNNWLVGRYNSFQNGYMIYKNGGSWQNGTFPILNKTFSNSKLISITSSSNQLGGVVSVFGYQFKPNTKLSLWLNNWYGSYKVDTQTSDAYGNVKFGSRYYDNNEAGYCVSSYCIVTLEVNDSSSQFEVVGARL